MNKPRKNPPPQPIAGVDHALRAATILQMEGGATVAQLAECLGAVRSAPKKKTWPISRRARLTRLTPRTVTLSSA